jgi:hypothetical protein
MHPGKQAPATGLRDPTKSSADSLDTCHFVSFHYLETSHLRHANCNDTLGIARMSVRGVQSAPGSVVNLRRMPQWGIRA